MEASSPVRTSFTCITIVFHQYPCSETYNLKKCILLYAILLLDDTIHFKLLEKWELKYKPFIPSTGRGTPEIIVSSDNPA
jgi:hypothetical protein